MRMDVATYLGPWPFRDIEGTVSGLRGMMRETGLEQALVSPLQGLFYIDPEPANARLLRALQGRAKLWAAPIVNCQLANAGASIVQLAGNRQVRAVRLAPGFHSYPVVEAKGALEAAAARGLTTIVQLRMQDERRHLPIARIPPVPIEEALALAESAPAARLIIAAARLGEVERPAHAERIRALPNLWLDISHVDGLACLRRAKEAVGAEKLLFSTNWPFFYARANELKIGEASLAPDEANLIMGANAARALGMKRRQPARRPPKTSS